MKEEFNREFSKAMAENNRDAIKNLLRSIDAADVNTEIAIGANKTILPLHSALGMNLLEEAKSLIDKGANVNLPLKADGDSSLTPLWFAIQYSIEEDSIEEVELLINNGADINAVSTLNSVNGTSVITPLCLAAFRGKDAICNLLIANGAKVDAIPTYGEYSAINIIFNSFVDSNRGAIVAKILINSGAKLDFTQKLGVYAGHSLLHYAIQAKDKELVELLIKKGADVNIMPTAGTGARTTPLGLATILKANDIATLLIDNHANVDAIADSYLGNTAFIGAVHNNNLELIKLLIAKKADLNIRNRANETPIMIATKHGELEIIKLLAMNGAKLNNKSLQEPKWKKILKTANDLGYTDCVEYINKLPDTIAGMTAMRCVGEQLKKSKVPVGPDVIKGVVTTLTGRKPEDKHNKNSPK